jgi:hypothetical protein
MLDADAGVWDMGIKDWACVIDRMVIKKLE